MFKQKLVPNIFLFWFMVFAQGWFSEIEWFIKFTSARITLIEKIQISIDRKTTKLSTIILCRWSKLTRVRATLEFSNVNRNKTGFLISISFIKDITDTLIASWLNLFDLKTKRLDQTRKQTQQVLKRVCIVQMSRLRTYLTLGDEPAHAEFCLQPNVTLIKIWAL